MMRLNCRGIRQQWALTTANHPSMELNNTHTRARAHARTHVLTHVRTHTHAHTLEHVVRHSHRVKYVRERKVDG